MLPTLYPDEQEACNVTASAWRDNQLEPSMIAPGQNLAKAGPDWNRSSPSLHAVNALIVIDLDPFANDDGCVG